MSTPNTVSLETLDQHIQDEQGIDYLIDQLESGIESQDVDVDLLAQAEQLCQHYQIGLEDGMVSKATAGGKTAAVASAKLAVKGLKTLKDKLSVHITNLYRQAKRQLTNEVQHAQMAQWARSERNKALMLQKKMAEGQHEQWNKDIPLTQGFRQLMAGQRLDASDMEKAFTQDYKVMETLSVKFIEACGQYYHQQVNTINKAANASGNLERTMAEAIHRDTPMEKLGIHKRISDILLHRDKLTLQMVSQDNPVKRAKAIGKGAYWPRIVSNDIAAHDKTTTLSLGYHECDHLFNWWIKYLDLLLTLTQRVDNFIRSADKDLSRIPDQVEHIPYADAYARLLGGAATHPLGCMRDLYGHFTRVTKALSSVCNKMV